MSYFIDEEKTNKLIRLHTYHNPVTTEWATNERWQVTTYPCHKVLKAFADTQGSYWFQTIIGLEFKRILIKPFQRNKHAKVITFKIVCLVWIFASQSAAMVMSERWVHLTTLFSWASLTNQYFAYILSHVTDNNPSWISRKRNMTVDIFSWSISTKVWDLAGIELATSGYASRFVTDCATSSAVNVLQKPKQDFFIYVSIEIAA